jgi:Domain of unknown function (DUF4188)
MAAVNLARVTHDYDGELVVFLIGMRINKIYRPDLWLPTLRAMPRMLAELSKDPDSGFLGYTASIGPDGPVTIQYWSSREKLYDYASNPSSEHRPAWTAFNRRARKASGAVGIWHETYVVDKAESIYSGMPPTGLAKATATVPVGRKGEGARERLAYTPAG